MRVNLFLEYVFAGKKRKTGDPYVAHPYAVRDILEQVGVREQSILVAALLHDVLEDTNISKEYLALRYGRKIAEIVDILSKVTSWQTSYCRTKSNVDRIETLWVSHPEAVMIKMADRIHNLQTIEGFKLEKQKTYIAETKEDLLPLFYEVLARNHLGLLKRHIEKLLRRLNQEIETIEKRLSLTC